MKREIRTYWNAVGREFIHRRILPEDLRASMSAGVLMHRKAKGKASIVCVVWACYQQAHVPEVSSRGLKARFPLRRRPPRLRQSNHPKVATHWQRNPRGC